MADLEGVENLANIGIRSPDSPPRSESLYRLSYPGPPFYTVKYKSQNIGKPMAARSWVGLRPLACRDPVRIPPGEGMPVSCECWVLSGRRADPSSREVLPCVVCHRMWSGATITFYTYNKQVVRGQTETQRIQGTATANPTFFQHAALMAPFSIAPLYFCLFSFIIIYNISQILSLAMLLVQRSHLHFIKNFSYLFNFVTWRHRTIILNALPSFTINYTV